MCMVFENWRRLSSVTHYCFYFLHLGYRLMNSSISFYNQGMVYSELQNIPEVLMKKTVGRVDLFVHCFAVAILFDFVFLTSQNRRVIDSTAIAFPQDTHMGYILDEVESLSDSNSLSFRSIIKNLFLQPTS